ncbi:MAG: MFS transporter [Spirosomataceae bacterium]
MENPKPNLRYAWYVVFVLMLAYVSSFIDRQILSLLVKPMKRDLHLSDTQMSLLMGFSFAIFYTFLGIPIGRLVDGYNRRRIVSWGIAIWSLTTAVCGLVHSYGLLFLARVGVGVGEAALSPGAYSIITDYFPKNKLATAISVYSMGIFLGSGLAILIGGLVLKLVTVQSTWHLPLIGEIYPWQSVFFIVGLPGLLCVLLMQTIKEPKRKGASQGQIPMNEVFSYLKANWKPFLLQNLGTGFIALTNYATVAWVPTFFDRVHGWEASKTGILFGLSVTVFSTLGIVVGGRTADYLLEKGYTDAKLRAGIISAIGLIVFGTIYLVVPSPEVALLLLIPSNFFSAFAFGAAPAAMQEAMPNQMRGIGSAIYLFIVNLVGIGLGPTSVALITDFVFHDESLLRYSMIIVSLGSCLLALLCLTLGLKPYRQTLARLAQRQGGL